MIYDVTLPISPALPVWPGDPLPRVVQEASLRGGGGYNLTSIHLSSHTGTHLDAPLHMVDGMASLEEVPVERLVGECWVARLPDAVRRIGAADLEAAGIPTGTRRLLLHTGNSDLWSRTPWEFTPGYAALTLEGAQWVVDRGIHLVGIDYLSVDLYEADDLPAHRQLLGSGVLTLESLDLRAVPQGTYRLVCLPLRVAGVEGAPARVILITP